jgi:hypothetical protein
MWILLETLLEEEKSFTHHPCVLTLLLCDMFSECNPSYFTDRHELSTHSDEIIRDASPSHHDIMDKYQTGINNVLNCTLHSNITSGENISFIQQHKGNSWYLKLQPPAIFSYVI